MEWAMRLLTDPTRILAAGIQRRKPWGKLLTHLDPPAQQLEGESEKGMWESSQSLSPTFLKLPIGDLNDIFKVYKTALTGVLEFGTILNHTCSNIHTYTIRTLTCMLLIELILQTLKKYYSKVLLSPDEGKWAGELGGKGCNKGEYLLYLDLVGSYSTRANIRKSWLMKKPYIWW